MASLSGLRGAYDGVVAAVGRERVESLNALVLRDVSAAAAPAVGELGRLVRARVSSVRSIVTELGGLPDTVSREIGTLQLPPDEGSTEAGTPSLVDALKRAAADPRSLYPRLACCADVPLDLGKLRGVAKNFANEAGDSHAHRDLPAPNNTHEATNSLLARVEHATAPLTLCRDSVRDVRDALAAVQDKLRDVVTQCTGPSSGQGEEESDGPAKMLLGAHEQLGTAMSSVRAMLLTEDDDDDEGKEERKEQKREVRGRALAGDVVSVLDEGVGALGVARGAGEAVATAGAALGGLVDALRDVWEELKALFAKAVAVLRRVAEAVRELLSALPRFVEEAKRLFFPSGLYALLLKPSPEARTLLDAFETVRGKLPDPDTLTAQADRDLPTVGSIDQIGKLTDTAEIGEKVSQAADTLPPAVAHAATAAVAQWAREEGAAAAQDLAADALQALLGGQGDNVEDGGAKTGVDGLVSAAGGLMNKIF